MNVKYKPDFSIISEQCFSANKSWNYEIVVGRGSNRLRVHIVRNSYDFQSWVRGYAFDHSSKNWNLVVNRPIETASCRAISYVQKDIKPVAFESDADSVLTELVAIVEM